MEWRKRNETIRDWKDFFEKIPTDDLDETEILITTIPTACEYVKKSLAYDTITCVGDYDVDGVCATTIIVKMYDFLGKKVNFRIPKRFTEGYGLSLKIADEIPENSFVITVDNGIAALEAIQKLKEKGCMVLLTDHHLPVIQDDKIVLPNADWIVDPALATNCSFPGFCGAMVAYKIAKNFVTDENLLNELKTLAGIATICDVMPLLKENRGIVKETLQLLKKRKSLPFINILLDAMEVETVSADTIGYFIGPVINASSRMNDNGGTEIATAFLNNGISDFEVQKFLKTNEKRKEIQNECIKQIEAKQNLDEPYPIVLFLKGVSDGLIGILAGYFSQKYQSPCIVFTENENGFFKGSGRSNNENVHLKNVLDACSDLLLGYGGHKQAAGLSVSKDKAKEFKRRFCEEVRKIPQEKFKIYDFSAKVEDLPIIFQKMEPLMPFGEAFPQPIVHIEDFHLNYEKGLFTWIGKTKNHLKLYGDKIDALFFNPPDDFVLNPKDLELSYNIYGTISKNTFKGYSTLQILCDEVLPNDTRFNSDLLTELKQLGKNRY